MLKKQVLHVLFVLCLLENNFFIWKQLANWQQWRTHLIKVRKITLEPEFLGQKTVYVSSTPVALIKKPEIGRVLKNFQMWQLNISKIGYLVL